MSGYTETPATKLRRLRAAELERLREALAAADLPSEDLSDAAGLFYALEQNGKALGYAGLEVHGTAALLRSVVIVPEKRGSGLGRRLVEAVLECAASMGQRDIYLLTTTASDFFLRLRFTRIDRDRVPAPIAATRQFAELCPATAICMHRLLVSEADRAKV
jgi:amino-acid N-acetyltransferase